MFYQNSILHLASQSPHGCRNESNNNNKSTNNSDNSSSNNNINYSKADVLTTGLNPTGDASLAIKKNKIPPKINQQGEKAESVLVDRVSGC